MSTNIGLAGVKLEDMKQIPWKSIKFHNQDVPPELFSPHHKSFSSNFAFELNNVSDLNQKFSVQLEYDLTDYEEEQILE